MKVCDVIIWMCFCLIFNSNVFLFLFILIFLIFYSYVCDEFVINDIKFGDI